MSKRFKAVKKNARKKYLYLKLCWNRALTHLNFFISMAQNGMIVLTFMGVYKFTNYKLAAIIGTALVVLGFYAGHLDIKHKILAEEVSLANKYNPEMRKLVRKASVKK